MSDNESDYYDSNSESDEESVQNVVLTKKSAKPIAFNHAKQFGGYEEDESEIDDSEPDDADGDEEEDDDEQVGGVEDNPSSDIENVKDDEEEEDVETVADEEPDDSDIEIGEDGDVVEKASPAKVTKPKKTTQLIIEDEEDDEDEYEENYLQKFDNEVNKNYIYEFHPECLNHNSDEIEKLAKVIRNEDNIIIDPLHRTIPYLTKYEKARVLGQRAKQIEVGAKPLVKVPENIIDSYIIAELELREKKIPFIIKRPIPGGAFEYWHLRDLENINF
jgi:DNA-directed RNA polymerase I, II, and III subunit RPABC2